ncbi:hypothetical protein MTX78_14855 [Hymenobacter tibetensis]|uniref:MFS transporter n=1 Tax=Hymenobacter tibetensis TaxID=497967 RepID=A0ABY4CVB6_9BACT|nr:hypothetical protein [Hymenobacter tibetensis]UOG73404.1 hypothetical protein MTX78_14855 [Hymenobacter tibetensis]
MLSSSLISAAASEALEFANGLAGSITNLGVTVGTTVGGWILLHHRLHYLPWAGAAFGVAALGVVALQRWQAKRQSAINYGATIS